MVIITGVAGSGKTTQCQKLQASGRFQWLSVGELLRQSSNPVVHATVEQGIVVDDAISIPIVEAEIIRRSDRPELLLDGFPRTTTQATWLLEKHFSGVPFHISHVVHITLSEQAAVVRLHARGRSDDYDQAIAKRLTTYEDVVLPIISHYHKIGIPTHEINGDQTVENVYLDITKVLQ